MGNRLAGKVVIVTGGARGQGEAEARLFAAEGATVVVTDVLDAQGAQVAREIDATFLRLDVSSASEWRDVVAQVIARHGRIDGLVNNAGLYRHDAMLETDDETWQRVIAVNQTGVFLGMKTVIPAMIERRAGSVVNVASVVGMKASPMAFAYATTKWAIRGMTRHAALEFGRFGVRVNAVVPGPIDTAMIRDIPRPPGAEHWSVPLGRNGQPGEVAPLALFLISDESSYSTGGDFLVDGGFMLL